MRLVLTSVLAVFLGGASATAQEDQPLVEPTLDLEQIEAVVATAVTHLSALDQLIATQEDGLGELYDQRDVATTNGQDARVRQLDTLIDRLNLTLTNLEAERDRIAASVTTLESQIDILKLSGD